MKDKIQSPLFEAKHKDPAVNSLEKMVLTINSNDRLGAFGWLARSNMASQMPASWISVLFCNSSMTILRVWRVIEIESASGPSLLERHQSCNHLVMPQNIKEPLCHRAILQSPAYQWLWDRAGTLNDTFTQFAENVSVKAKCANADVACLRSVETSILQYIKQGLFQKAAYQGIMPVGPSVDGDLVPTLVPNGFRKLNGK
jgi:carboxylesterase type B